MEYNLNQSVVADLYQIPRISGKYDQSLKKIVRKGAKVLFSYVQEVNALTDENGKMYIIDHQATEERFKKQLENADKRKANEQLSKVSATDLLKALNPESVKQVAEPSISDEEIEKLKTEYKELSGDDAKANWKPETLAKKVEELKNKE